MGVLKAYSALLLTTLCSWSVLVSAQYRLPGDTEPLEYTVTLKPTLEGGQRPFSFEGSLDVNVIVRISTTTITLHAYKLEILDVTVLDANEQPIHVNPPTTTTDDRHFLVINLNRRVEVDEILKVHINYIGLMEDDMYGWYRSWYMEGNTKKWLASTQFQATHARRALPCYDEPGYKVPFKFSFVIPEGLGILFNTQSISTLPDDGNTKRVEFEATPAMSSYLLAFVLSNFETLPGENYAVWSRPNNVQQTAYAKSIMEPTVNAMIDMVNVPFVQGTINKLDTVAVPDFSSGAMENWGLITYRERLIHWEQGVSSERNKQALTSVVAHEIAHQWFGDLVSPAWWNNLWLNEGFATYFEFFACHVVENTWRMDEQFVIYSVQDALRADGLLTSSAMNQEAGSPSSISAKFDTISYEKGGSVIRMMELFLGTLTFRMGLNLYLQTFALRAAMDDDLFHWMDSAYQLNLPTRQWLPEGVTVTDVMKTWVDQAGYPVITVERNFTDNTTTFSQERFLYSGNDAQSVWYVPLTMTSKNESDFSSETKAWLTSQQPLQIDNTGAADEWILVNINQGGFYRVNYDVENWLLLAEELETSPDKIPAVTRAQLVDDALNLARGGVLDYSIALSMTRFLVNETDFIPWASALTAFSFLNDRLHGSETHSLFQKYVRLLLETVSKKLGYKETTVPPAELHVDRLHRNQIATWACNLGVQECLDAAKTQFQDYRRDESLRVGPDMKSVVYCHGLLQGNEEDWTFLWEKYLGTQTATEQTAILVSLGCSTNTEVLNSYLLKSIADTDEIRRQDALTVFSSTYARPDGLDVALAFVTENVQNITTKYGGLNVIRNVVSGIASRLSTTEQIDKVKIAFESANLDDPTISEAVTSALESARKNVEWTQNNRPKIHEWLENEVGASSVATLSVLLLAACFTWLAAL